MTAAAMITVKKADGTIEKISLDEFKSRQKKSVAAPAPVQKTQPVEPAPAIKSAVLPAIERKPEPVKPPVIKPVVTEIKKPIVPPVPKIAVVPPSIKPPAESSSMPKPPVIRPIEVRKPSTEKYSKEDSKSLLEEEALPPAKTGKPLVKPMGTPKALLIEEESLPSTSAPVNSFIHAPQTMRFDTPRPSPIPQKERTVIPPSSFGGEERSADSVVSPVRPLVRDIAPGKPSNLGPVEELRYFSLVDFRRLSSSPEEAAARLKQKLINLREESHVLYLDGLSAWRESPLFRDYIGASVDALNTKRKLADSMADDSNKIQMKEIQAIIQMEGELF